MDLVSLERPARRLHQPRTHGPLFGAFAARSTIVKTLEANCPHDCSSERLTATARLEDRATSYKRRRDVASTIE
jgi:hypothetical protein